MFAPIPRPAPVTSALDGIGDLLGQWGVGDADHPVGGVALALLTAWGLVFAAVMPIRQAYLNGMIPSERRATVLSFDSLMGNAGGVVIQPALGRAADVYGYPISFVLSGIFAAVAVPFLVASRRERSPADHARDDPE